MQAQCIKFISILWLISSGSLLMVNALAVNDQPIKNDTQEVTAQEQMVEQTQEVAETKTGQGETTLTTQVNSAQPVKIEETVLGMNVSGTRNLPNVLYIIPWKGNKTQVSPPQISRLVDEIYAPVDPEVFSKQVKFYYQLTAEKVEQSANMKEVK
ncbi:hypothetical protein [Aliikangiella maris]|uniref:Uncharacterized protein n=2 Tax=Aliikangiella maris TaxID=3162458 RepID=A0ABV2BNY0_9GAMM